jgi:DNA-binding transcriptional LysR family regulator
MLEGVDALVALEAFGTVSEAATRLRLTQSAVSKRIRALQVSVGFALVEPDGRRLRLTARGVELLERARPLVAQLRGLTQPVAAESSSHFALALADSIASSWGPAIVRKAMGGVPRTKLELHSHRSVLVIESVRLGRYDIGLCTEAGTARDLVHHPLVDEPMVLVHAHLARKPARDLPLITIEPTSATWRAIQGALRDEHAPLLAGGVVSVESFGAVLQMVRAGFGNGLVPLGLAMEHVQGRGRFRALSGVARRVCLLTRKTIHQQPTYAALRAQLEAAAKEHFARRGGG